MSPNSAGAFHTFSERYSANVVALMLLEVSLPEMLYKLTGRGVKGSNRTSSAPLEG